MGNEMPIIIPADNLKYNISAALPVLNIGVFVWMTRRNLGFKTSV